MKAIKPTPIVPKPVKIGHTIEEKEYKIKTDNNTYILKIELSSTEYIFITLKQTNIVTYNKIL